MKITNALWGALVWILVATGAQAQIRIGMPSGITGAAAAGVKENIQGAKLYIDAINRRGGVHGQSVELIAVDDHFDPATTAEVGRRLIVEQNVVALFLNRGTPHAQALLPLLAEHHVPLVGPSTGAMALHEPVQPWVFNVRATYQREAIRAVKHLASLGMTRIAVLPTDDTFGADGAIGAEKGFAETGLKPVLVQKFPRENPDLADLAAKVKASDAQAVLYIGSSSSVANGVKALRAAGSRVQVVTLSNNASEGFIKLLGEHARGVIVTQVFPNERAVNYRLIKEAQELAKAKGAGSVSPAMIEGFAAAKVLVEGLRRAGPKPTGASLREALEGIQKFDIGGLEINYSPTSHSGLDFADLSIIGSDGKFMR